MFESLQRDPHRPAPIARRPPGASEHDAHAHSPQRSAIAHLADNISHSRADAAAYRLYPIRNPPISMRTSAAHPSTFGPGGALSNSDDPFMGPSSAGARLRLQVRSNNTDDTMPDYVSAGDGHSRAATEMSGIAWPRRDFQRHMDEAAVDEIIDALSSEKREQLIEALSPTKSFSPGLLPPANTPKTVEASKQRSPVLARSTGGSSTRLLGLKLPGGGHESTSGDSSVRSRSAAWRKSSSVNSKTGLDVRGRSIVTRSQRAKKSTVLQNDDVDADFETECDRSSSSSSKRKRSLSPTTNVKTRSRLVLRCSPHSESSDNKESEPSEGDS
jgi:hypothetical protein